MTSSQCDAMKVSSSLNYEARIERLGVLSSRPSRPAPPQRAHELGGGDIVGGYHASHRRPRWLLLQRLLRESGSAIREGERHGECGRQEGLPGSSDGEPGASWWWWRERLDDDGELE